MKIKLQNLEKDTYVDKEILSPAKMLKKYLIDIYNINGSVFEVNNYAEECDILVNKGIIHLEIHEGDICEVHRIYDNELSIMFQKRFSVKKNDILILPIFGGNERIVIENITKGRILEKDVS